MAFVIGDRIQETTNSPGTGTATLLGAVSGYQSFSTGIGANNTTFYVIADQLGTNWEVGLGALNSTGTVLTRTTVYSSSNGGSTVNFATGTQYVWCDFPSSKAVIQGTAVNFSSIGATTAGTGAFTTLSASSTVSGAGFSNYFAAPPTIGNTTPNAGNFTAVTTNQLTIGTTQLGAGNASIMKNRIINGAMVIDQRNAGASVTITGNGIYSLDRWQAVTNLASKYSMKQNAGSVTPPAGFTNYLGVTSLSAYSVGVSDFSSVNQTIEGFNIADLGWGTANAKTVTLSFWVYSSLTGTFGGSVCNTSVRSYPFVYSIPTANTWTQIAVTIPGDTTGTWATNNTSGISVRFGLGCGSNWTATAGSWVGSNLVSATGATSVVGTNGATFYITGVQLEVGSSATGFEYRQYQQELALCQRYLYTIGGAFNGSASFQMYGNGLASSTTNADVFIWQPVTMRSAPTLSVVNIGNFSVSTINAAYTPTSAVIEIGSPTNTSVLFVLGSALLINGQAIRVNQNNSNATQLLLTSEL